MSYKPFAHLYVLGIVSYISTRRQMSVLFSNMMQTVLTLQALEVSILDSHSCSSFTSTLWWKYMAQLPKGGLVRGHDEPIHGELRHLLSRVGYSNACFKFQRLSQHMMRFKKLWNQPSVSCKLLSIIFQPTYPKLPLIKKKSRCHFELPPYSFQSKNHAPFFASIFSQPNKTNSEISKWPGQ